jgi:hypothetical protein
VDYSSIYNESGAAIVPGTFVQVTEQAARIHDTIKAGAPLDVFSFRWPSRRSGRLRLTYSGPCKGHRLTITGTLGFLVPSNFRDSVADGDYRAELPRVERVPFASLIRIQSDVDPGVDVDLDALIWTPKPCEDGGTMLAGLYSLERGGPWKPNSIGFVLREGQGRAVASGSGKKLDKLVAAADGRVRKMQTTDTTCDIAGYALEDFTDGQAFSMMVKIEAQ